jgi:hypothetical protein
MPNLAVTLAIFYHCVSVNPMFAGSMFTTDAHAAKGGTIENEKWLYREFLPLAAGEARSSHLGALSPFERTIFRAG